MNDRIFARPAALTLSLVFGAAFAVSLGSAAWAQEYEHAPKLKASAILPAELMRGPHHRVDEQVLNDGYMNHSATTGREPALGL